MESNLLDQRSMADADADRPEVVVITGASAGVGRAVARRFASEGARIALLARGRERLDTTLEEVSNLGGEAIAIEADVSSREQIESAADRVEDQLGPIDIWINNAAATVFAPAHKLQTDEIRRVTDVTYHGAVWGTLAALTRMSGRDKGKIIQVCSEQSVRGLPLESAFAGASHAIRGFTESLRAELLHEKSGVRLSQLTLPPLNTPRYQWTRSHLRERLEPSGLFQPEVAAEAVYWISRHDRRDLTLGWRTLGLIWSDRLAPEAVDAWLGGPGFESRMSSEPDDLDRPDNLFESVPGNFAAHGNLNDSAARSNAQLLASEQRALILGGLGALALLVWLRRR